MNKHKDFLQKNRLEFAKYMLEEIGIDVIFECKTRIEFYHNDELVQFFPYTGWHTGKSIKDGRGLSKLLKQLK